MTATIESFTPNDKATDIADTLRRDGAAIVRNVVTPKVMDDLAAKLEPRLAAQEIGGGRFFGHRRRSVAGVFAMEPEFTEHFSAYVKVENLFDETYIAARRPAGVRPGLPRTAYIGFTYG